MRYSVLPASVTPEFQGFWDGPAWRRAPVAEVAHFRPESSAHRPRTECRLLYDEEALYGIFRVQDRFVRCVHTGFQEPVYRDSCVEAFVQPKPGRGYFNFEFNCGGALLAYHVLDPTREEGGRLRAFVPLDAADEREIRRFHSLPREVEPERTDAVTWLLEFALPRAVLERYVGPLGSPAGQEWRANFYKCGDETSHPHWAAWAPVDALNFHLPEQFGYLEFR